MIAPNPTLLFAHVFVFLHIVTTLVFAQSSEPSHLKAYPLDSRITLDGILDEDAWQQAMHISNFTQRELHEGEPATERTEVAILYTEKYIYIGVWAYDSEPDKIVANLMQRDFGYGTEDHFKVIIDPYNADRDGYLFVVNANGARADALIADNGNKTNSAWNGVWDVAAKTNALGWFAEIQIPVSILRIPDSREQEWGINFERNIRRKQEQVLWQGWSRDCSINHVRNAGTLVGLQEIETSKYVDLRPYGLFGAERSRNEDASTIGDAGLDADYLVTPTMRLSVTVNPDFAQVESDAIQLNLTRFSLYYSEKRRFFLEGQEFFDFNMGGDNQPFYSRRIGISDKGSEIPIVAGARLLGKTGGSTLGAMVIQTAETSDDATANYAVVRYKQDVMDESYVGMIGISRVQDGEINVTYGGDMLYSISDFMGDKNLKIGALVAQSYTSDAGIKNGGSQRLYIEYPNDLIDYTILGGRVSNEFIPKVGYQRRTNFQTYYTRLDLYPRPKGIPWITKLNFRPLEVDYYGNDVTGQLENFTAVWRPLGVYFTSGEYVKFDITRSAVLYPEEYTLANKIKIQPDTYWYTQYIAKFTTFTSRPVYGEVEYTGGEFLDGTVNAVGTGVTWRANKYVSFNTSYEYREVEAQDQFAVFNNASGRVSFAFSPNLFGSFYGQWAQDGGEALMNFRINWIPHPGSDVYLVINQRWAKEEGAFLLNDTAILSKVIWRFEV